MLVLICMRWLEKLQFRLLIGKLEIQFNYFQLRVFETLVDFGHNSKRRMTNEEIRLEIQNGNFYY